MLKLIKNFKNFNKNKKSSNLNLLANMKPLMTLLAFIRKSQIA